MYKSVYVHPDNKPRTHVTRIRRIPLNQMDSNELTTCPTDSPQIFDGDETFSLTPHLPSECNEPLFREVLDGMTSADMTLDEIM